MAKSSGSNSSNRVNGASSALLIIDLVTDFEFEDGDELLKRTMPAARKLSEFKSRAKRAGLPVIYVNDNFGKWQEDFKTMADHFRRPEAKGHKIVSLIAPEPDDYYVLKPHRSAFYSTTLELLLRDLKVKTLIVTGVTTDICILFSANDAYMRGFDLHVPRDCVAAVKPQYTIQAMGFIKRVLKADVSPSTEIVFGQS
jgi:nicotinamidase-related amidase